ncbi:hypothetical protein FHS20_004571 [Phyllobacterium endophyticum]|nr:hypothetical protein [Phyllobacterium endophyticum]
MPYRKEPLSERRRKNTAGTGSLLYGTVMPVIPAIAGLSVQFPALARILLATRGKEFLRCIAGYQVESSCRP